MPQIEIAKNPDELSERAAELFLEIASVAIEKRGDFAVALSGGSTPRALYRKLVTAAIDWSRVFFFFGDERNVLPTDEKGNFRMADDTLFSFLPLDDNSVYRWHTEIGVPEKVANDYGERVKMFFRGYPRFDLVVLGLGSDGHTASLFPNTAAARERSEFAAANWVETLNEYRFTMTFPVINNAANVIFLVSGKEKAPILKKVLENHIPPPLPAQLVQPTDGRLVWLIDEPAAALLDKH